MMSWQNYIIEHAAAIVVCAVLIAAAVVDWLKLRVPNWMTFPLIVFGLIANSWNAGWPGCGHSMYGVLMGLGLLLPLYSVGGMGAGDVKLLAGVGAWLGPATTLAAFTTSAAVGAVLAIGMSWQSGRWTHHYANLLAICEEWRTIRNPKVLARLAAERRPNALLLPYAIPICIGSISYFIYAGLV